LKCNLEIIAGSGLRKSRSEGQVMGFELRKQAQDKLTALANRRLIRSLTAFSLAKEDQVNENA
jgi:hypothetical protein